MYLYLTLNISLNLCYVLFISMYHAIVADRKPIFLLLFHILLPLTPFKNEELLYLSGQTICHMGDDWKWDFDRASRILSFSLSLFFSAPLVNRNRRFVVTTTLDNEIEPVAVNGLIAGIIIILGTSIYRRDWERLTRVEAVTSFPIRVSRFIHNASYRYYLVDHFPIILSPSLLLIAKLKLKSIRLSLIFSLMRDFP